MILVLALLACVILAALGIWLEWGDGSAWDGSRDPNVWRYWP